MRDIDTTERPLLDHLVELRRRLLWCVLALLAAFAAAFGFANEVFAFLARPLAAAMGGEEGGRLIYTKLFEAFFVQIKVAFFTAIFFSFPVFATQLWRFVAPGLYREEKQAFLPFLLATPPLFLLGAAMGYFLALPVAIRFLLGFQKEAGGIALEALPAIGDYLGFVMQFIMGFGIAFLLPVLLMILERAGIVTREQFRNGRRYAILGAFVIAAVLTPPDVLSQFMLAIPLILLYEAALIGMAITGRRRARAAAARSGTTAASAAE
jgi:sec-independent protein translocase protein TatC